MIRHNLFFCLFVFIGSYLMWHVSALNMEGIANGKLAKRDYFTYQAAIFVKEHIGAEGRLICNGAIVAPKWILSITSCFMMDLFNVKDLIFMAVVSFIDYTEEEFVTKNIEYIYTHLSGDRSRFIDLAMAKTKHEMTVRPTIRAINTPDFNEMFSMRQAVVSGYGCSKVETELDQLGNPEFVQMRSDYKLRYTYVRLDSPDKCHVYFPYKTTYKKYCGVAKRHEGEYTGMCWNDVGSPAVVREKVIALATTYYSNCDDTQHGSLYIQTPPYYHFIENSKNDTPTNYMVWYPLRQN